MQPIRLTTFKDCCSIIILFFIWNTGFTQHSALFDTDEILEFTLSCDMKSLMKDRDIDSEYHEATVQYEQNGTSFEIPLRVKTRGHFRKMSTNCKYPPIYLNFAKATTPEASIFRGQDKTKLVTPCRDDNFVINEYLVYKLYNLLISVSLVCR